MHFSKKDTDTETDKQLFRKLYRSINHINLLKNWKVILINWLENWHFIKVILFMLVSYKKSLSQIVFVKLTITWEQMPEGLIISLICSKRKEERGVKWWNLFHVKRCWNLINVTTNLALTLSSLLKSGHTVSPTLYIITIKELCLCVWQILFTLPFSCHFLKTFFSHTELRELTSRATRIYQMPPCWQE